MLDVGFTYNLKEYLTLYMRKELPKNIVKTQVMTFSLM